MVRLLQSQHARFARMMQSDKWETNGFKDFVIFIPIWGNDPILTIFFRWGWFNHQLGYHTGFQGFHGTRIGTHEVVTVFVAELLRNDGSYQAATYHPDI